MNYRPVLNNIPPVVKNLIIVNVLFFLATKIMGQAGTDFYELFGLYFPASSKFMLHQLFTHMFMHGSLGHIFFNMFALYMFGRVLESVWGPKRFLTFYLVTGLGAAALHLLVIFIQYRSAIAQISPEQLSYFKELAMQGKYIPNSPSETLTMILNTPTVGASGAVFGILLGFGMLFPNTQLMLLFPPIPIKAKYFVMGYGAIELYLGIAQPGSDVAHFAHLGGMLFGYFMIRHWRKNTNHFY
jgi:membrane associated rhomboid family serine protease